MCRFSVLAVFLASVVSAQPLPLRYTLTHPNPADPQSRYTLAGIIGDHDGDGAADFVTRQRSGATASLRMISGVSGSTIQTIQTDLGYPFVDIGDASGDGMPDFVIGAPTEEVFFPGTGNWVEVGAVYLFDGATGTVRWRRISPQPEAYNRFGGEAAPLGDVDGDGRADVLIGEPDGNMVHAFSGATGAHLYTVASDEGSFGVALVALGDLDGDGANEVAVSSVDLSDCWNCGRVRILSGATGAVLRVIDAPQATSFTGFGLSMGAVHDVDGDGMPDLAVTASGYDAPETINVGRAYVFSVATGAVLRTFDPPTADVATDSVRAFGVALATGADLDGDGAPDVAVTARRSAPADRRVYLFSGATGEVIGTAESPSPGPYGYFGSHLALLGGWGGRLVVAASDETVEGVENVGRVYVYGVGTVAGEAPPKPERASLAVSPNPSSGASSVTLTLPSAQALRVAVVDALGRTVAVLHDGPLAAGRHRLALPATLAPGVYAVTAAGASARLVVAR